MPLVALVCAGLFGWADDGTPPPGNGAAEYRQAQDAAGRGPGDQVRLALWCEAHGLTAERARHLALALLADPANTTARGLSGLVARDGRWVAPDAVAQTVRQDGAAGALRDEYGQKRSQTPYTADAQWSLGVWADEHGLKDQARAHFTAVTRLDPAREIAWKRLGYRKHDGHWATDAQVAAAKAEAEAQKDADRTWKPLLEKWRGMLDKPSRREEARTNLLGVTDPRAVPAVARIFGTDRAGDQQMAISLLGQIESPQASRALATLAVFSRAPEVRRAAVETLRRRDPRDFVGFWIALIRPPIRYEVQQVGGPGSPGSILIAGPKANTQRIYRPIDAPNPAQYTGMTPSYDANGLPVLVGESTRMGPRMNAVELGQLAFLSGQVQSKAPFPNPASISSAADLKHKLEAASHPGVRNFSSSYVPLTPSGSAFEAIIRTHTEVPIGQMMQEAQLSSAVAQQQVAGDVARLEATNAAIHWANDPVVLALQDVTGQTFGEDDTLWNRWWADHQGYALAENSATQTPTFVENVPIGFTPVASPVVSNQVVGYVQVRHSCFGAGTAVRTIDGSKLIEQIRRGDQVLVQDTVSGALSYQPVLTAFHNPPSPTYRVGLGTETIVATGIHRFWKVGKGWTMTRDLRVGDSIRALDGVAAVTAVESDQTQPVFNLEVAEGRSFFVGSVGALVHDNSLVEATPNPFDAATLAAALPSAPAQR